MLIGLLTEATCGEACWHAVEDVCRCSCAGRNHGCLRTADGKQPVREAKIDGVRYRMAAAGKRSELFDAAVNGNKAAGFAGVDKAGNILYHYRWELTEKGAPYRLKYATASQVAKWPELSSYRDAYAENRYFAEISILC